MAKTQLPYNPTEEKINVWTHKTGIFLSLIALVLMLLKTIPSHDSYKIISSLIYGLSLITLYTASTLYHRETNIKRRRYLNIFDHAAIFILIAGTYTPFALVTLKGFTAGLLLAVIWSIAGIGIWLKFYFTGRYEKLSTLLYLIMGWLVIFFIKPLMMALPLQGLYWLIAGGLFYTIGAIFFSLNKIKFNHAIFHVFVLWGSLAHFIAIYIYVLTPHH